jgi:hypothetical protein
MMMYAQLIEAALERVGPFEEARTIGDVLSELIRCRNGLDANGRNGDAASWALHAVANEVAYDVVLIALARQFGIDCDPHAFDQPREERTRLEDAVAARGFVIDELDDR